MTGLEDSTTRRTGYAVSRPLKVKSRTKPKNDRSAGRLRNTLLYCCLTYIRNEIRPVMSRSVLSVTRSTHVGSTGAGAPCSFDCPATDSLTNISTLTWPRTNDPKPRPIRGRGGLTQSESEFNWNGKRPKRTYYTRKVFWTLFTRRGYSMVRYWIVRLI